MANFSAFPTKSIATVVYKGTVGAKTPGFMQSVWGFTRVNKELSIPAHGTHEIHSPTEIVLPPQLLECTQGDPNLPAHLWVKSVYRSAVEANGELRKLVLYNSSNKAVKIPPGTCVARTHYQELQKLELVPTADTDPVLLQTLFEPEWTRHSHDYQVYNPSESKSPVIIRLSDYVHGGPEGQAKLDLLKVVAAVNRTTAFEVKNTVLYILDMTPKVEDCYTPLNNKPAFKADLGELAKEGRRQHERICGTHLGTTLRNEVKGEGRAKIVRHLKSAFPLYTVEAIHLRTVKISHHQYGCEVSMRLYKDAVPVPKVLVERIPQMGDPLENEILPDLETWFQSIADDGIDLQNYIDEPTGDQNMEEEVNGGPCQY